MRFRKKDTPQATIPSASMSDVVFTLLLFFMVSTVLKKYQGIKVEIPEAFKIEKLVSKTHTAYIWISKSGEINFDDIPITSMTEIEQIGYAKISADPQLIVFLRVDQDAHMKSLSNVQEALRKAQCFRIFYATKFRASPIY